MATLTLYTCKCDRKTVDKTAFLDNITVVSSCRIKEPCSMLSPTVQISKTSANEAKLPLSSINYAHVDIFNRYYFVNDITFENDGLITLSLEVDVLMTYAGDILSSQQEVIRSEKINSKLYIDPEKPIQANKLLAYADDGQSETGIIGAIPSSNNGNHYVLTVAGG